MSNNRFHSEYAKEIGDIDIDASYRSAGKKIMTWRYTPASTEKKTIEIPIHYHGESGVGDSREPYFTAYVPEISQKFKTTDIKQLKDQIIEAMEMHADVLTSIVWEDWYEVKVSGSTTNEERKDRGFETSLMIRYRLIRKGILPSGREITKYRNTAIVDFPNPKRYGEKDKSRFYSNDTEEVAYIKATPENTAALKRIIEGMDQLRGKLTDLLSQTNIHDALASVETHFLLPEK